jgi:hypothetical protein
MPDFSPQTFRFTDPRQARIHGRLALVSPGIATFYRDACFVVASSALATTTHLATHLLREIESAIRSVALPGDFEFPDPCPHCGNRAEAHKRQIQAILAAYEFADTEAVSGVWLKLASQSGESLARFAHRDALGQPRPAGDRFRKLWDEMETLLDLVMRKFERRFLDALPVLDGLLAKPTPGAEDAKTLRNKVPQNLVTLGYFFDRLQNSTWLPLLRKESFFAHPTAPERDEENGTIAFPPWPQSRFLARMAKIDAVREIVMAIALEIPDTENVAVQQDLVDVATALPPGLAVKLVPRLKNWTASPYHLIPEKFAALTARLAEGGEVGAAFELARAQFAVLPNEDEVPRSAPEDEELRLPPRPRGHFETWHYRQGMQKVIHPLVRAADMKALEFCSDLLSEALRLSSRDGDEAKPEDYSAIWRPVIESQGDRSAYGVKDALVSAVRDAAELIVKAAPATLPHVVGYLEGRGWNVFRRIALHLLRVHPQGGQDLIAARLTDRTLFEASYFREFCREYRLLARAQFGTLSPEQQAVILDWIEAGPDLDEFRKRALAATGHPPTADEMERFADEWRLEHLAPIVTSLPAAWRAKHESLVRKHGAPTEFDLGLEVRGVWTGPTSAKPADELRTMAIEEIITFLRSWVPERRFMAPSAEGLARELTSAVTKDPERFAAEALRFKTVDPTYGRALVSGLRQALREKHGFTWRPVLELTKWVVDQPATTAREKTRAEAEDRDPGWTWARQEIARLIASGFDEGETEIPFPLRPEAWEVLYPLTSDPDPTVENEVGRSDSTALEVAINTTRGEALDAVIRYAAWVRRNIIRKAAGSEEAFRGLVDVPEARDVLDDHLDLAKDPAPSMRAVYGRHLPWLVHLDRDWVLAHRAKLFPVDPTFVPHRDALWDTYVTSWRPIDETFEAVRDEYAAAVERIGRPKPKHGPPPDESLAEHLMVFYWRGRIPLSGEGAALLGRFFEKADDPLRAAAIESMGRSLGNTEGDVPPDVYDRFVALWTVRLTAARETAPNKELAAFGWWFGSKKLDPEWAMAQLLEVLKAGGKIDADFLVVEYLADQAPEMPVAVMDAFILLVEGAEEPWNILSWHEHLERAIPAALASRDPAAAARGKDLVNLLAARGHLDFRRFLKPDG